MNRRDPFTITMAAKACRMSEATIRRLFDEGILRGYKVPGSSQRHRRIPRKHLLAFMREHGIPTDSLGESDAR
jgi:excisionase family DNA binding protein